MTTPPTIPITNLTTVWSDADVVYNGIKLDVQASAYSSSSKLINLLFNDSSKFSVDRYGNSRSALDSYARYVYSDGASISKYGLWSNQDDISVRDSTEIRPQIDIIEGWDVEGGNFTGIRYQLNNVNSDSASKLIDFIVNESTKFNVDVIGNAFVFATVNAGTGFISSNRTITGSSAPSLLDLSEEWDGVSQSFTGIKYNVTDTNSADLTSYLLRLQVGGTDKVKIRKSGDIVSVSQIFAPAVYGATDYSDVKAGVLNYQEGTVMAGADGQIGFANGNTWGGSLDVILRRDATDTLALRRGENPQAFHIYNANVEETYYQRAFLRWGMGTFFIGTEGNTGLPIAFNVGETSSLHITADGLSGIVDQTAFEANDIGFRGWPVVPVTESRSIEGQDSGKMLFNNTDHGIDLTILNNDESFVAVGTEIKLVTGESAGYFVKSPGDEGDLTIIREANGDPTSAGWWVVQQNAVITLLKVDTNLWYIWGTGLILD